MSDSAMKHTSGVITKTITSIPKEKRPSKIVSTVLGAGIFYLGWQVMPANASIPSWVGYVTAAYGGVMACGDYVKAPWRIIIAAARDVINLVSAFMRAKRGGPVPPDEVEHAVNVPEPLASQVLSPPSPLVLKIKRVTTPSSVRPTFGVFYREDGTPFAVTLERSWVNNEKGKSCIPLGTYPCVRVNSPKFGDTFEVTNVPGRDKILFHKGNIDDDSHGCILVAENFAHVKAEDGIAGSAEGFAEFKKLVEGVDAFTLVVQQA